MTNRPGKRKARGRFSEAEISRVLRAIKKTGVAMEIRIEPEGGIHIFPSDRPMPPDEVAPKNNSWSDFRVAAVYLPGSPKPTSPASSGPFSRQELTWKSSLSPMAASG